MYTHLHILAVSVLHNRWSAIASHLPRRTDNEIKNYWNTHLKKRLTQMGIDPTTHYAFTTNQLPGACNRPPPLATPPWTPLLSTQLTHMTQWDLTLAEAQARLSSPFLQPFTPPPTAPPASPHPSASFMRSWKTRVHDTLQPKLGAVKLEPKFHILQDWVPSLAPTMATGVVADTMALGDVALTEEDAEIFVPRDRLYGVSGSVVGGFHNGSITESPTTVLHGPDSDATSPCGSATSDCFDLVRMHQSMMQNFPAMSGNGDQDQSTQCGVLDTFWQRQHAAMVEALRPDGVLQGDGSASVGCISELVVPLDFSGAEFPQFENILCQGEQYQADCALEC